MNPAHLHLITNHIPIVGSVFCLLLLLSGLALKDTKVIILGLLFVVLVSLGSIPAYLAGEEAEDVVEGLPGISETSIEEHEEAAEAAFVAMLATGGLALVISAIGIKKETHRHLSKLALAPLLGLLISGVLLVRAANLGGMISHPEIRGEDSAGKAIQKEHREERD